MAEGNSTTLTTLLKCGVMSEGNVKKMVGSIL